MCITKPHKDMCMIIIVNNCDGIANYKPLYLILNNINIL